MTDPPRHIAKAERSLATGEYLFGGGFAEAAGREAYLAALHAALALIVSRTGKEPRTHSGARSEFARLAGTMRPFPSGALPSSAAPTNWRHTPTTTTAIR